LAQCHTLLPISTKLYIVYTESLEKKITPELTPFLTLDLTPELTPNYVN